MAENKVRFNLKNAHYAILTETVTQGATTYSYGTPKRLPGAVTLTLDASGETTPFYADGIVYYQSAANSGYEGSLELARVPDIAMQDIFKQELHTTDKTLTEYSDKEFAKVALLYQIDGDAGNNYYVLYNVTLGRPGIGSTTNTATKDPQTQTMSVSATPRDDNKIMARTTHESTTAVKAGWFTTVYEPTATPEPDPEET